MEVTPVYLANLKAFVSPVDKIKVIANKGGSSSSKTYSILQLLITIALKAKRPLTIDIARNTLAECKKSVMKDFFDILKSPENNLYNSKNHDKTYSTYRINNSIIQFIGLDDPQKIRGARRDILYVNEANGVSLEKWLQLSIRTRFKIIYDFNPSEKFWHHSKVEDRVDAITIHSTYKDNPFLSTSEIKEIEELISVSEYYYKVYVLGEDSERKGRIITNYEIVSKEAYEEISSNYLNTAYGFDDGYSNDPMALVEGKITKDGKLYLRELFYKTKSDPERHVVPILKERCTSGRYPIYPDPSAARTKGVFKMQKNFLQVKKVDNSINDGIVSMQFTKIYVCETSVNWLEEAHRYVWKIDKHSDECLNIPIDKYNHLMDATRYLIHNHPLLRRHKKHRGRINKLSNTDDND